MQFLFWFALAVGVGLLFRVIRGQGNFAFPFLIGLVLSVFAYFALPPLAPWFMFTNFLICAVVIFFAVFYSKKSTSGLTTGVIALSLVAMLVVPFVTSTTMLRPDNATRYRNLLDIEEVSDPNALSVSLTDPAKPREVDEESARKSAQELLGSANMKGIGTQFEIGTARSTMRDGELVWVMPLEHKRLWPCLTGKPVPGYAVVSQSNRMARDLITDRPMVLAENSCFSAKLERAVYTGGYSNYAQADPLFQISPEGKPYHLVPLMKPQIGFGGTMPVKYVLAELETGKLEAMSAEELPSWINRIAPVSTVIDRIDEWGKYVKPSWWNANVTGLEVLTSTPGMTVVPMADGSMGLYTGIQFKSSENTQATSGILVMDQRTLKGKFYPREGITETAACRILEGRVQEKGYDCPQVVLHNLNGTPIFLGVLKDQSGTAALRGIVSQLNREVSGIGETLHKTKFDFVQQQRTFANRAALHEGLIDETEVIGVVERIALPYDGFRVMMLENQEKYFLVPVELSPEVVLTEKGETVELLIIEPEGSEVTPTGFNNTDIRDPAPTELEIKVKDL